jgi:hypothetical protein
MGSDSGPHAETTRGCYTPPAGRGIVPIAQPMRFDFVINLEAAQALGLTIPHHVLLQATEVIQ